jgi:tetratricopeptide (TPR) repeat protein
MQINKPEAAIDILKWNVELYPESPNVYDSLADGYEANRQIELAIEYSKKALEILDKVKDIPDSRRNTIKQSAEAKLKRLKK